RVVVHAGAQVLIPGPAGRGAVVVVPEWMVVADRPGREGRPDVDLDHAGAGGERLGEVRERGLLVAVVQAADRDLAERRASTFGRGGSRGDGRREQDGHYGGCPATSPRSLPQRRTASARLAVDW